MTRAELTPEEKLQKELDAANTRVRYLEQRLERLGAIVAFMARYDQKLPPDPESSI
jgi:hypothetical protein